MPVAALVLVLVTATATAVWAGTERSCRPVVDPYPGTRYEGADLRRIRAEHAGCATARRVVRGAHREALRITPPASGLRRFTWRGWRVTGDLRGEHDRYVARRGERRVRWLF